MKLYKKANMFDALDSKAKLFALGILIVVMIALFQQFETRFDASADIPAESKAVIDKWQTKVPRTLDYIALIFYIGLLISSIILARTNTMESVLVVILIIFIMIAPFAAMVVANIWSKFAENAILSAAMAETPILVWMLNNIVYLTIAYTVIVGASIFIKEEN